MTINNSSSLARSSIREHYMQTINSAPDSSILSLLAASSLTPLVSGNNVAPAIIWLASIGNNRLANLIYEWSQTLGIRGKAINDENKKQIMFEIARHLQMHVGIDEGLIDEIAALFDQVDAIQTLLEMTKGQNERQIFFLQSLINDVQALPFLNSKLQESTLQFIQSQIENVRISKGNSLKDVTDRPSGTSTQFFGDQGNINTGTVSIGGAAGTTQNVNVSGGTIQGSIIGSQTEYYGRKPIDVKGISQEEIDDQLELLNVHRRTLAVYLMQQAKHGAAYAPPGIMSGIREARTSIRRIKSTLQAWGVAVADHPDDDK